jgi:hypothetical protein
MLTYVCRARAIHQERAKTLITPGAPDCCKSACGFPVFYTCDSGPAGPSFRPLEATSRVVLETNGCLYQPRTGSPHDRSFVGIRGYRNKPAVGRLGRE